ncbi:MAG: hypothetical protein R2932_40555 [Caldilineaceae bacterium]
MPLLLERQRWNELADYLAERGNKNVAIVNIESVPALEALDDILAVNGLGRGPHRSPRLELQPGHS